MCCVNDRVKSKTTQEMSAVMGVTSVSQSEPWACIRAKHTHLHTAWLVLALLSPLVLALLLLWISRPHSPCIWLSTLRKAQRQVSSWPLLPVSVRFPQIDQNVWLLVSGIVNVYKCTDPGRFISFIPGDMWRHSGPMTRASSSGLYLFVDLLCTQRGWWALRHRNGGPQGTTKRY